MNEIIKINNYDVEAKEYNGQRVLTFKDIDTVHERPDGTAKRNFETNKKHFVEGEDFFLLKPADFSKDEIRTLEIPNRGLTVFTEQGYLMLVKSLTDDLAWKVQRELVKTYFKAKDAFESMSTELKAIIVVDQRVTKIEKRVEYLEKDIPMYGSESDELSNHVKRKGVEVMGGKSTNAYRDNKLRSEVYADIYNQIKREFGLYDNNGKPVSYKALKRRYIKDAHILIDNYVPPKYLEEKINDYNSQLRIDEERSA